MTEAAGVMTRWRACLCCTSSASAVSAASAPFLSCVTWAGGDEGEGEGEGEGER